MVGTFLIYLRIVPSHLNFKLDNGQGFLFWCADRKMTSRRRSPNWSIRRPISLVVLLYGSPCSHLFLDVVGAFADHSLPFSLQNFFEKMSESAYSRMEKFDFGQTLHCYHSLSFASLPENPKRESFESDRLLLWSI